VLILDSIQKSFGAVAALRNVSLQATPGAVHAIIGENGAGKSTLMKILSGVHQADAGQITLNGKPFCPATPLEARRAGIAMIYQELTLAPHLTVEENMLLGIEQRRMGFVVRETARVSAALESLGDTRIRPGDRVGRLSIGQQQLVEIARALLADARVIIMDEPTSSLSETDARALFEVIRRLRAQGRMVLYISHFIEEVQEICDHYTVLRDGVSVDSGQISGVTQADLIARMAGRSVENLFPPAAPALGEVILDVNGLCRADSPHAVSFQLRRGEILGIAGLIGAGRSEMLRTLFGLEPASKGACYIVGHKNLSLTRMTPRLALTEGLDMLSEDRKTEGLALNLSIAANITLSALNRYTRTGLLNLSRETAQATLLMDRLRIKAPDAHTPAQALSGGNQQKICLARLLHHDSDILLLDEPTRGIDVGSRSEVYDLIRELAAQGKAIIMVSSYLPELMGVCTSLAVMHRGQLSAVQPVQAWTTHSIMQYAAAGESA
jgi:ribose transport system ATP-binding protein